jgi:hypothetical protein
VPELRGGVQYQKVEEPLQVQRHQPPIPASQRMFAPAFRRVHAGDVAGIAAVSFAGTAPAASWRFGASVALVLFPERKIWRAMILRLMLLGFQGTRVQL